MDMAVEVERLCAGIVKAGIAENAGFAIVAHVQARIQLVQGRAVGIARILHAGIGDDFKGRPSRRTPVILDAPSSPLSRLIPMPSSEICVSP